MPEIWHQQSWDTLEYWVNTILEEASDELNDWETNFVNDIQIRISNRRPLTKLQQDKLEHIYAEKTS